MTQTQSDYTPKDFLQKLLGKSSSVSNVHQSIPSYKLMTKYEKDEKTQQKKDIDIKSPKNTSIKRFHLQSIKQNGSNQNNTALINKQNDLKVIQSRKSIQFKQISRKGSIKINTNQIKSPKSIYLFDNKDKNNNPESYSNKQIQIQTKKQGDNQSIENNLIFKKTQFFLKNILQGKISQIQTEELIKNLQIGFSNPFQFDKLIENDAKKRITNIDKPKQQKIQKKIQIRSKSSFESKKQLKKQFQRKIKSQEKYKGKNLTRKQKKQQQNRVKLQISKTIKKIKNIVLVNQKSLKLRSKKSSK